MANKIWTKSSGLEHFECKTSKMRTIWQTLTLLPIEYWTDRYSNPNCSCIVHLNFIYHQFSESFFFSKSEKWFCFFKSLCKVDLFLNTAFIVKHITAIKNCKHRKICDIFNNLASLSKKHKWVLAHKFSLTFDLIWGIKIL